MAAERHLHASVDRDQSELGAFAERESLERGVAKIVALGAQTGVTADQMIALLKSGLTVGELLAYLAARSGELV